jgi:hypothetical protein
MFLDNARLFSRVLLQLQLRLNKKLIGLPFYSRAVTGCQATQYLFGRVRG